MLDIEQKYKDLYNSYGGKSIRLIFFKDNYRALYPSETLYPSEQIYPSEMSKDSIAFEIGDDMVHTDTLTITESLCSNENLNFGACESAQMEIVVSGLDRDIAGKEFMLIESFADYELVRGVFTVDSTPKENDRNTRRIIAYDRMRRFDNDVAGWYESLEFPMNIKDFRKSLCEFVGVPESQQTLLVNDEILIEKTLNVEFLNGRDVLRSICQINGVFGNINLNGELRYIAIPKKQDISDIITTYKSAESEEYTVPDIDTIKIQKEEGDIGGASSGGDDMNFYIVEGNFLVYGKTTSQQNEIANNILSVVSELEYRPATIEGNGSPWYEMGDRIRVKTSDGDVDTIIMFRTSTGIQGAMDTISSTGSMELKRVFSIQTQVIEAKGLTAILKRTVEEVSNDLSNLEKNTTSKFTQTAEQIQLEVERAKKEEGQLKSSITQTAEQIALKVSKGDVTSQLNSELKITGNSIALTTGHFTINAKNMTLDAQGNASFSGSINVNDRFTVDSSGNVVAKHINVAGMTNDSVLSCETLKCYAGISTYSIIADKGDIDELDCGVVYANNVWGNIHDTSDERLKNSIKSISRDMAIDIIKSLNPVSFSWNSDGSKGMGFIAQEVKKICEDKGIDLPLWEIHNGIYGMQYNHYISVLVAAMQGLIERIGIYENSSL